MNFVLDFLPSFRLFSVGISVVRIHIPYLLCACTVMNALPHYFQLSFHYSFCNFSVCRTTVIQNRSRITSKHYENIQKVAYSFGTVAHFPSALPHSAYDSFVMWYLHSISSLYWMQIPSAKIYSIPTMLLVSFLFSFRQTGYCIFVYLYCSIKTENTYTREKSLGDIQHMLESMKWVLAYVSH